MSQTLGEKLRQSREAQGISIREVADQTRISALYIECIENDDYRTLPGGIFNKGFVKSYAKFVGVDPQEALQDYVNLIGVQNINAEEEIKSYRPEVLLNNQGKSLLPTIVVAAVILGLTTVGILFLLKYLPENQTLSSSSTNSNVNSNGTNSLTNPAVNNAEILVNDAPVLGETKIEFRALQAPISVTSNFDGKKGYGLITPEKPLLFEPKQNLLLSYSKSQAQNIQMTINGKPISLPSAPANALRKAILLEITNENLRQIWETGAIKFASVNTADSAPQPR